jgi:UDP-N-acetylmuramoyl-tripeptide--D-alanyl-D-alanine ligase
MRAALALVGALPLRDKGRRIAILGDMLELGRDGAAMHAELARDVAANHIDLVFAAGPLTKHLFEALPGQLQGAWRDRASDLVPIVGAAVQSGDMVIVKGSNASRMSAIVDALKQRAATDNLAGAVKC